MTRMGLFMSRYSKFDKTLPDVSGKVFAITGKQASQCLCLCLCHGIVVISPKSNYRTEQNNPHTPPNGFFRSFIPSFCR